MTFIQRIIQRINDYLKKLYKQIQNSDNHSLNENIEQLKIEKEKILNNYYKLQEDTIYKDILLLDSEKKIQGLLIELEELKNQLQQAEKNLKDEVLEYYWNNKIKPVNRISYPARGADINVLQFYHENNDKTPNINGTSNDEKANNALRWVKNNIMYTPDKTQNNTNEFWMWANETMDSKLGDCEDGAILMANIMIKSGVPYWRVRINAGDVQGGGHAYVTYLREADNTWYVLDWCYWYDESVNFKKSWKDAKKYFGIWWSFNNKYGFMKDTLDR